MRISLDEVSRIARLAQLAFTPEELEGLRADLDQILTHIEKLQEIDTGSTDASTGLAGGGAGTPQSLREDRLKPWLTPEEALANAPESGAGHFKVPKVIP